MGPTARTPSSDSAAPSSEVTGEVSRLRGPELVVLTGEVDADGDAFVGDWDYSGEQPPAKPFAFQYRRSKLPAPIPAWQLAMMRGADDEVILELWDPAPTDGSAAVPQGDDEDFIVTGVLEGSPAQSSGPGSGPVVPLPYVPESASAGSDPPPSWPGSWEGHFVLRKNGRDAEVRERFYLEQAKPGTNPEDEGEGAVPVTGGGTNVYGRFQLRGSYHAATRALVCRRAYVSLPRKKKRRRGASTVDPALEARAALRTAETDDATTGQRRRRAPSKFDGDEDTAPEKSPSAGRTEGKAASSRPKNHRSRSGSTAYLDGDSDGDHKHEADEGPEDCAEEEEDPFEDWDHLSVKPAEEAAGPERLDCEEWREAFLDEDANEVYEGEVAANEWGAVREGHGVCVFLGHANAMYEGEWAGGREHGRGVLMTATRQVMYEGEWSDGRINGQGTYFFNGGAASYAGEWRENSRHGKGSFTFASGSRYEGEWRENLRHGKGSFEWSDGSRYDGDWHGDKRHGRGRLELSNGLVYEGGWVSNEPEGRGVMVYPDGSRYEGMFKRGTKDGRGSLVFPNGASYEGRFRDDGIDGQGTLLLSVPVSDGDDDTSGCWMIPVAFQSDMQRIHAKAGFDKEGL